MKDSVCSLGPYFEVQPGKMGAFRDLCRRFVEKTQSESGCLYYGFTFCGDVAHCREGYVNAEGVLAHLENVGPLLGEALQLAKLVRLEVHGPAAELAKLRAVLEDFQPDYFELECGVRKG